MQDSNDKIKSENLKNSQDSDDNSRLRDLDIENKVVEKTDIDSPDHQESLPQNEIAERRGNTRREITAAQEKQEQKKLSPKAKKKTSRRNQDAKGKKKKLKLEIKSVVLTLTTAIKKKVIAKVNRALKKSPIKRSNLNKPKNKATKKQRFQNKSERPTIKLKTLKRQTLAPVQNKQENFHTVIDGKEVSGKITTQEINSNNSKNTKNGSNEKSSSKLKEAPLGENKLNHETVSEDIKIEEVKKDEHSFSPENFGNMTPDSVSNTLNTSEKIEGLNDFGKN